MFKNAPMSRNNFRKRTERGCSRCGYGVLSAIYSGKCFKIFDFFMVILYYGVISSSMRPR